MPDTLPWEDFATAPAEHGPWEDFAQGGIINNNATPKLDSVARFINKAAAYSPFALQESTNEPPTIATALGIPAGPAQGFAALPQEILKQGNVQNLAMLPFLSGEAIAAAPNLLKALIGAYFAKGAAEQGGAAAGKLSVTGVPKLPLAPGDLEQQVVAPIVGQKAPEMGGTTEQWQGLGELANALLMGAGAKGVMGGPKGVPSGIGPGDVSDVGYSRVPEERQLQAPAAGVPQDRQLPRFAETGQTGMTQPSSGEVTQLPQLLSKPQFVTDPRGQVVDVSQLTPWEEAELMRGPREYSPPQQGPVAPPFEGQKQLPPPSGGTMQAGPTTIKQTLSNVEQQLKGEQPQLPGQKVYSGVGINPEDLRPAVEVAGRLLVGQKGDTHADVLERNGFDPREVPHTDPRRMFATADGKQKFDRQAAARIIGKGTAEAGGADSMDLPGAAAAKLMSKMEAQDKAAARTRAGRGETQYFSGVPVPDLEDIKDVFTPKARLLLRSPEQLKLKTEGQVDAGQLVNRLLNTVPGSEKETLEASGIREAFKLGQKATVKQVDEWVRDNGPKVEVRKLEGDQVSKQKQRMAELAHRFDSIERNWQTKDPEDIEVGWSPENKKLYHEYQYLDRITRIEPETESATARYTIVNPKPLEQMPGAVDLLVRVPQKTSIAVPGKFGLTPKEYNYEGGKMVEPPKYTSFHYPTEGKNLLAHVRGYMETTTEGKKVFHVFEVQSDWAREARETKEFKQRFPNETPPADIGGRFSEPLLKQYERLALKAAIEHARSQGADAIAISDAKTAMMTEGHDRVRGMRHFETYEEAKKFSDEQGGTKIVGAKIVPGYNDKYHYSVYENAPQSPGMRLHYDRTLPKIAEELTGSKGERVEFGEHQNAYQEQPDNAGGLVRGGKPRADLIFKNETGQPKTNITARQYDLSKTGPPPYSTTGSRLYSGVPLPELEKVWDTMKKWYAGPVADTKDWSPLRDPEVMKKEILESKTATPITSKVAGITLPTEGATTTLADRLIDTKNALGKKIASVQDLVNKGDKMYSPMDVVFDMADGGKARFNGPLFRNIRWPLDFDFNAELNLRKQKMDPVRKLVKKYDLKEKNGLRLGIYAMVQQGATERLVKNGVPQTYIDNIVKTLSPQEKEVYTLARRQLDSLLPSVQQVAKDVLGLDVQPVKDYFPMQRDWRDIPKPPEELAKPRGGDLMSDAVDFLQADFTKRGTKTERGYTIERVPDAKTAVKLNFFDVYERHVKDVAHFVASQKRLNEIAKIVRDPVFAEKYGDVTQKLTMDWLNAYAKQGRNISALPQLDWMRKAIARGVLGFRVASQFVHLANVPLGMQRAGLENYTKGLAAAMSEQGQAFLRKNLAETFERGGGELELIEKQGTVEKAAFAPQRALDRWNSQATSLGIYLREGGTLDGPVNEKALAQARVEARRAVASPLYKDLPPLLRTQSGKIFAQFQNTFMDQWSNIRYDLPAYLRDNPKKAMGLLVALAAMTMVESGIKHGAKKGLQAATGYEPKHGDEDTYWKKVGHEALRRIPGYGQLSSMWEYGSSGVPLLDVVKEEGKAVKETLTSDDTTGRQLAGVKAVTGAAELAGVTGAGQLSEVVQNAIKAKGYKPHSKRIQEIADKAGLDLSDFKQRLAGEAVMKENREPMTEAEKLRSAQAAMKNMSERRQTVMNGLNKEDKQWLKTNKIEPPGFGDYVEEGKVRVPYTDAENRFATETYKSEYETVISYLRNDPGFKQMGRNEQQVKANEEFRAAARRARETVVEVVKSGALVEKSKKKRFSAFAPE